MTENDILEYFGIKRHENVDHSIIGLVGGLGAGKTSFVRRFVDSFFPELSNQVCSPTYTLCNLYSSNAISILHFDLYRIELQDELYDIGLLEALEEKRHLIFVEWIDLFPEMTSYCDELLTIIQTSEGEREYFLESRSDKSM